MIKSYSLFTPEADSVDIAVQEITTQLAAINLCTHSVGIVCCHYDYINNGIIAELLRALPFPLIGITTFYQATSETSGLFSLTITVLTSDDVRFSIGYNSTDSQPPFDRTKDAYESALGDSAEPPAAIFSFLSLNRPISGDEHLRELDLINGGVPCFGAVTIGDDDSGTNIYVICGDQVFTEGFALLLLFGDVNITYHVGNFSEDSMLPFTATVTGSSGTVVKELNGQPAKILLEKNGVSFGEDNMSYLTTLPHLIQLPGDQELVARALAHITDRGELTFLGEIPEGSRFHMGTASTEDILTASRTVTLRTVSERPEAALLLMFSCVGRFTTLGLESTSELDYVKQVIPSSMTYLGCYTAGEICPTTKGKNYVNRFHNSSFVVCALA